MSDEEQQEILFSHARNNSLTGVLPPPAETVTVENPLCGDGVTLSLLFSGEQITEARAEPQGCFICRASASILVHQLQGKTKKELRELSHDFRELMRGEPETEKLLRSAELLALKGIRQFPIRIRCVLLPFDALGKLLGDRSADTT